MRARRPNYAAHPYHWLAEGEEPHPPDPRAQPANDWRLVRGGHAGLLMSRDSDYPAHHTSYAACVDALKQSITRMYIWYAYAIAPDGTSHTITHGAPYDY